MTPSFYAPLCAFVVLFGCEGVQAQNVSGEFGFSSMYMDGDLFALTKEPVVQAGLYLDVWGSHGVATSEGAELNLGASCRFNPTEDVEVEVSGYRDFLIGFDDMTEFSVSVVWGSFAAKVIHFVWDNNPDATRFLAGYTIAWTDKLLIRPNLVYQIGFGERDVFGGGMTVTRTLGKGWAITGTVMTPLAGDRSAQVAVGLNLIF
jgi:hypothetical protein